MAISFPKTFPVACHTDMVGKGSTFVAIQGMQQDGTRYISDAIERGATCVVVAHEAVISADVAQLIANRGVALMRVDDTRRALAQLSARAAGNPAEKLKIIGITGTKGKTTTSALLHHLLLQAGYAVALLSTVHNKIGDQLLPASLTTAQPDYLHQFFALCVQQGITHVVMEVAAQAIPLHRVEGIAFDATVFTNFGLEHLEFFPSLEEYFTAKKELLFRGKKDAPAFINGDDDRLSTLVAEVPGAYAYGFKAAQAELVAHAPIKIKIGADLFECPALCGEYNAYNVLVAVLVARWVGVCAKAVNDGLGSFAGVRGRFETYTLPNNARCIIDYAHNPLSYQALLPVLRSMTDHLIVVFGAGGDRDPSRRPQMGAIAAQYADIVVLTNDNPRSENPETIMADILRGIDGSGIAQVVCCPDRELAIKQAYAASKPGSIIALLGKGPDEYQIIGTQKTPFNEVEILKQL